MGVAILLQRLFFVEMVLSLSLCAVCIGITHVVSSELGVSTGETV